MWFILEIELSSLLTVGARAALCSITESIVAPDGLHSTFAFRQQGNLSLCTEPALNAKLYGSLRFYFSHSKPLNILETIFFFWIITIQTGYIEKTHSLYHHSKPTLISRWLNYPLKEDTNDELISYKFLPKEIIAHILIFHWLLTAPQLHIITIWKSSIPTSSLLSWNALICW